MRFRRALGIGAGYGLFDRLLPTDLDYTGIDIDPEAVAYAARWASRHRPRFRYLNLSLGAGGFPARHFDLILLSEVIEHMPESEIPPLFTEIDYVLSPGGHLLLTIPNHLHLRNRIRRLLGQPTVWMDRTHLREYTLTESLALVKGLPFQLEKFKPAVLYFPLEPWVAHVIPPQGRLRRLAIQCVPQIASHFIFLLQKTDGNLRE
jgi:SAM-dependent methyltransferase